MWVKIRQIHCCLRLRMAETPESDESKFSNKS